MFRLTKPTHFGNSGRRLFSPVAIATLREHVVKRNACALQKEIESICSNLKFTHKHGLARNAVKICALKGEFSLACDVLECLQDGYSSGKLPGVSNSGIFSVGMMHLIDECLSLNNPREALLAYDRLKNAGSLLDVAGVTRLVKHLSNSCEIVDILRVLKDQSVSVEALQTVAEPLLMSGMTNDFAKLLRRFFMGANNQFTPASPSPACVAKVVRSITLARIRRSNCFTDDSQLETTGMESVVNLLQDYHDWKSIKGFNSRSLESYFYMHQLMEFERSLSTASVAAVNSPEEALLLQTLPCHEGVEFPYLMEDRHLDQRSSIRGIHIHDLTTEIYRQQPDKLLLFHASLFPQDFENEMMSLKEGLYEDEEGEDDYYGGMIHFDDVATFDEEDDNDEDDDDEFDDDDDDIDSNKSDFGDDEFNEEGDDDLVTTDRRHKGHSSVTTRDNTHFNKATGDAGVVIHRYEIDMASERDPRLNPLGHTMEYLGRAASNASTGSIPDLSQALLRSDPQTALYFSEDFFDQAAASFDDYSSDWEDDEPVMHSSSSSRMEFVPTFTPGDGDDDGGGSGLGLAISAAAEEAQPLPGSAGFDPVIDGEPEDGSKDTSGRGTSGR